MKSFRLGAPWFTVAGLLSLGMLIALFGHVRFGGWVMGAGLMSGAMMRAALPERYVDDIRVRSRTTDIAGYAGLAFVLVVGVSTLKL